MREFSPIQKIISRLRVGILKHAEATAELVHLGFKDTLELHEILKQATERSSRTFLLEMADIELDLHFLKKRQMKEEGAENAMQK